MSLQKKLKEIHDREREAYSPKMAMASMDFAVGVPENELTVDFMELTVDFMLGYIEAALNMQNSGSPHTYEAARFFQTIKKLLKSYDC